MIRVTALVHPRGEQFRLEFHLRRAGKAQPHRHREPPAVEQSHPGQAARGHGDGASAGEGPLQLSQDLLLHLVEGGGICLHPQDPALPVPLHLDERAFRLF